MPEPLDLEELLDLIRRAWGDRYARGRVMHVHRNAIKTARGQLIHLRVLVQAVGEAEFTHAGSAVDDLADQP